MMRMRNIVAIFTVLMGSLALTSCGTTLSLNVGGAAAYADDLYAVHDRAALAAAEAEIAAAEAAARAESERRIAAMVAAAQAEDDIDAILGDVALGGSYASVNAGTTTSGGNVSIYNTIYVDDYSSAYARRLQGFSSMTYRLPSSYYDYRYSDAYFITMAYDPAFYTVMIVGDQVWVEPRYITNMFGSWNNPYYYGYRYGYNPYYYGYSYCYYDPWGWNSPYWGCDPYWHYHSHHYWHGPHYGHNHNHHYHPGYHNPSHKPGGPGHHYGHNNRYEHRPSYGMSGSSTRPGGGRLSYSDRLGGSNSGSRTNDRGAAIVSRPVAGASTGSSGSVSHAGGSSARPGNTVVTNGRPTGSPTTTTTTPAGGRPGGTPEVSGSTSGNRGGVSPNDDLVGSLSTTTLRGTSSSRGNSVTGSSNSSSRVGSTSRGSSSSRSTATSPSKSSSNKSTNLRIGGSSKRSSSSSSTTRSSSSSSSSRTRSSVSSSSSRSSSSRSSVSSGSSSSRSSSSSSSRSSSSSSRGGRGR